jgi:predicted nucleotidyltransferase
MRLTVAVVKRKILPILKRHGVVKAAIFGSVARGEADSKSDVDILIKFRGKKSLFDLGGLYADLEEKLGRRPDLVTYKSIDDRRRPYIMKDAVDIL